MPTRFGPAALLLAAHVGLALAAYCAPRPARARPGPAGRLRPGGRQPRLRRRAGLRMHPRPSRPMRVQGKPEERELLMNGNVCVAREQ